MLRDIDGNDKYDEGDMYGIISGPGNVTFFSYSFGCEFITFDEKNVPRLVQPDEKFNSIYSKLYDLNKADYYYTKSNDDDVLDNIFINDRALFRIATLDITERYAMRDKEEYGIVPLPKYDELQTDYYTFAAGDAFAFPLIINNLDMSAIILNELNKKSYLNVQPEYYNIALQRKYTRDEDSNAMLDIIFSNITCDFAYIFFCIDNSYVWPMLYDIMAKYESYSTWWAANEAILSERLSYINSTINQME